MKRIKHYKACYEMLDEVAEQQYSLMQIFKAREKVLVHRSEGHIQSRVVYYLMNIHIIPRLTYLPRHGESIYNLEGRIGESELSYRGREYIGALAKYIHEQQILKLRV